MAGAAHLCSAACVKGGAGLVTVFCPKSILGAVSVKNTEAMAFGLPDDGAALGVGAFAAMKEQLLASDAILVGCGLRAVPGVKEAVKGILSLKKPCVLDADAINVLDKDASLDGCVITPHPGEMARLLGVSVSQVEQNRLAVAADFAKKSGAVVVLKGARTVISAPDGKTRINVLGNAGMATGGAGDVLAGLVCAFLAQGFSPFEAACKGVYAHALAGDLAKAFVGEYAMGASDILQNLAPALMKMQERGERNDE